MLKLKQIIRQLDESDFGKIAESFNKTKAENYHSLLLSYRENKLSDTALITTLEISSNSFYVLKSRLYDKIQDHLSLNTFNTQENLTKQLGF